MLLYLDIETVPSRDPAIIQVIADTIKPPGNMKKAETIEKWAQEEKPAAIEEAVAKTSFDGAYGSICSIAYAINDGAVVARCEPNERDLLAHVFCEILPLVQGNDTCVVGHNVVGFDLKFLWKRAVVLGLRPPPLPFNAKPWDSARVFDTMAQWDGDKDKRISLDNLCRVLGIESPKTDLDGSLIAGAFAAGRYADIATYNAGDVEAVRNVYKRMTFAG